MSGATCNHSKAAAQLAQDVKIEVLKRLYRSNVPVGEWDISELVSGKFKQKVLQDCHICHVVFNDAQRERIQKAVTMPCPVQQELVNALWTNRLSRQAADHLELCDECNKITGVILQVLSGLL